jgi:cytochrome P450
LSTTATSLGESFDPLGTHLQDPYPFYEQARAEEPVFWSPRMNAWVVTRYEDAFNVLRDTQRFSNANAIRTIDQPLPEVIQEVMKVGYPPQETAIIMADGDKHRIMRAPWARRFAPDRVTAAEPVMRARAAELVGAFADDGRADLMRQFANPLPVTVLVNLYGIEELKGEEELVAAGTEGLMALQANLVAPPEKQVEAARAFVRLVRRVAEVVKDRMAHPREDDLPTVALAAMAPDGPPLPLELEGEIVLNLAGNLLPGHETTSAQIGNGVRHLLTHRDQWELLCERPELIPNAVEEICRYDTGVPGMFRVAKTDVTIGGRQIPAGGELFLALISANRDEALCDRPNEFDITRSPTKHLTFGHGSHYCLGAETGRRELRIALETLTNQLPTLRLTGEPLKIAPVFVTRRLESLPVEF